MVGDVFEKKHYVGMMDIILVFLRLKIQILVVLMVVLLILLLLADLENVVVLVC